MSADECDARHIDRVEFQDLTDLIPGDKVHFRCGGWAIVKDMSITGDLSVSLDLTVAEDFAIEATSWGNSGSYWIYEDINDTPHFIDIMFVSYVKEDLVNLWVADPI